MKKLFLLLFTLFISTAAMAATLINGIYYNLNSSNRTAEVTNKNGGGATEGSYSGRVGIPSTVSYGSITYNVTSIGDYAFRYCPNSLTSVTIPNSVTSIGKHAFNSCYGLTSITIPNSVTSIGEYAFSGCIGLTSLTISNSLTSIENMVFHYCSSLTSITIPNSVTSIGESAFDHCSGLTSITIPSSVTKIWDKAFYFCTSLTSVSLPNGLTYIGNSAFSECTSLKSVTIPSSVTSIKNSAFYDCTSLTSITIPSSVTSIGDNAFYNCKSLTSVDIPNGVTSIGKYAFSSCSGLTSITIPSSVTSIGDNAFDVTEVIVMSLNPITISSNTFTNRTNATLYVPYSSYYKYRNANYWKEFKVIKYFSQSLSISSLPVMTYGDGTYTLPTETEQNLPLSWTSGNTDVAEISGNILTIKGAGNTTIRAYQNGNDYYPSFSKTFTLTVNKAPLTIKVSDYERDEGEDNPEFSISYEGFVNGEDVTCLTQLPTATCNATSSSSPGTYTIYVNGAISPNYNFNYVYGTLTVKAKETYAHLSGNTLTFYHDSKRETRYNYNYSCYILKNYNSTPEWCTPNNQESVTSVVFDSSIASARPKSCYGWFLYFSNLRNIQGLQYLNTSEVTDMHGMFAYCSKLQLLNVGNFDTGKVTDMAEMFEGCTSLLSLDVSNFNTENVTSMTAMFSDCSNLSSLDVSNFNTGKVTTMNNMFSGCRNITTLNLEGFDTSKTNAIYNMFTNCSRLTSLTLSNGMSKLNSQACSGVGTSSNPCQLNVPGDFDFGNVSPSTSSFQWKSGYFKVNYTSVVITANSYTIQYGDAIPTLGYTSQGPTLNGTPTLSCAASPSSPAGTYVITVSKGGVTNSNAIFVNGTLTITKAQLTVTAKNSSMQYGDALPTFEITYSGFKNNETASVLTTQPTLSTTATSTSSVGTYAITPSGAEAQNYEINYVNGTLTITKAPLTITANNNNMQYGDALPTFEATYSGFKNGETANVLTTQPTLSTTATSASPVGTYTITPSGAAAQNYAMTYVNGTLTINKAPLTITANSYTTEQGDPVPTFEATYDGFKNGESASVLTTQPTFSCEATQASEAGEYAITPSGAVAQNYELTYVPGTLSILPTDCYAVLSDDGTTLTFYNDATKASHNGQHAPYDMNTGTSNPGWYADRTDITTVVFSPSFIKARPTTTSAWFRGMDQLTSVSGMEYLNTSEVKDMRLMFYGCSQLSSIDLSHFNTGMVSGMRQMFYGCSSLTSLDLSQFDASNTSTNDMNAMFYNCSALETLTLPASMASIAANACSGVGTETNPCQLVTPEGFDFGEADPTGYNFQWKSGWFVQGNPVFGDVNRDEEVDVVDVVDIALYVVGTPATDFLLSRADINKDGSKNIADAVTLTNLIVGDTDFANTTMMHARGIDHLSLDADGEGYSLCLDNSLAYTAAQMEVTLNGDDEELEVAFNVERRDRHQLLVNRIGDRTWRVVMFSTANRELLGNSGELLHFDTSVGDITVSDIHFVTPDGTDHLFDDLSIITGIHRSLSGGGGDDAYYDLQGRKVDTPTRGVYIHHGRKVVVK